MFVDIHNHSLFGVDDGPEQVEETKAMLRHALKQGAEAIVFTPHYRHGMFHYPAERIQAHYEILQPFAKELGINIYLGCEYHVNSNIIEAFQAKRCQTLAESDYVLMEYSYTTEYSYIAEYTSRMVSCGFFPVIAHAERYKCIQKKPSLCVELSNRGALIQINADSVLGIAGFSEKQCCKKILKNGWADIIASDAHNMTDRECNMERCKGYVEKKYGNDYAEQLFVKNPRKIISSR